MLLVCVFMIVVTKDAKDGQVPADAETADGHDDGRHGDVLGAVQPSELSFSFSLDTCMLA